ncbi:UNKNOWN [Stylonychia lemnae]|uniref:Uncharacterized protein n=1 Tax=Stylonychia lemnae TaxID=5949 RepID=A0A078AEC2_STYLE|nr:UNKNOWN [Stylonychia lemnae]|eukprot:CDW80550.1 UNKNOWN [Stylonychia lemnae]
MDAKKYLWNLSKQSRIYLYQNLEPLKYQLQQFHRRGKFTLVEGASYLNLMMLTNFFSEIDIFYPQFQHFVAIEKFFEKMKNVKLRKLCLVGLSELDYSIRHNMDLEIMLQFFNMFKHDNLQIYLEQLHLSVERNIFRDESRLLSNLTSLTLGLSQVNFKVETIIIYPKQLKNLSLDYYYSPLHEKFLENLPINLEQLTFECPRVHNYQELGTKISNSNVHTLKIKATQININHLFKALKDKPLRRIDIYQSSFDFLEYHRDLQPLTLYLKGKQLESFTLLLSLEQSKKIMKLKNSITTELKMQPSFRNINVTNFFTKVIRKVFPKLERLSFRPIMKFEENWIQITKFSKSNPLQCLNLMGLDLSDYFSNIFEVIKSHSKTLTKLNLNSTKLNSSQQNEIVKLLAVHRIVKNLKISEITILRFDDLKRKIGQQDEIDLQNEYFTNIGKLVKLEKLTKFALNALKNRRQGLLIEQNVVISYEKYIYLAKNCPIHYFKLNVREQIELLTKVYQKDKIQ